MVRFESINLNADLNVNYFHHKFYIFAYMLSRLLALLLLIILSPLFVILSIVILLFDGSPIFFVQKRIGKNSSYFNMYKFRTMKMDTPNVATRLLENPDQQITKFGKFLRKFSFDELPNLINMIKGEMGFVGPRPVLASEGVLVGLRKQVGVDKLLPGLTGLAQINGRGELSPEVKVKYELEYKERKSLLFDIDIVLKTTIHVLFKRDISL